jgi:hypothetical protein
VELLERAASLPAFTYEKDKIEVNGVNQAQY